jgi:hypothetical protein
LKEEVWKKKQWPYKISTPPPSYYAKAWLSTG